MSSARLIDGRLLALLRKQSLQTSIVNFVKTFALPPSLHVFLIGHNPASHLYVNNKQKACRQVGIPCTIHEYPDSIQQERLLEKICQLNQDASVHGIFVQLPLPAHLPPQTLLNAIDPLKDVDGLHPYNLGRLMMGAPTVIPCTPKGCLDLIHSVKPDLRGQNAVVVGRSILVGKPMAALLTNHNATVTLAHSQTKDLISVCRNADILVVATGTPEFFDANFIKPGTVIIDVGINRIQNKAGESGVVGDVDTASAQKVAGFITPVPGGVGPMTISCLLENTLAAAQQQLLSSLATTK